MSYSSTATLSNSIVWGNVADFEDQIFNNSDLLTLSYCNVQGGADSISGPVVDSNVFDFDPLFVDSVNGDLHLSNDSPCIDAGDPAYLPLANETDIDGEPRLGGSAVDLGADEVVGL